MGASSEHPADSTIEAGLPNITGSFNGRGNEYSTVGGSLTDGKGAFRFSPRSGVTMSGASFSSTSIAVDIISFDASRSSSIYGQSSTVQPSAYFIYAWKRIE